MCSGLVRLCTMAARDLLQGAGCGAFPTAWWADTGKGDSNQRDEICGQLTDTFSKIVSKHTFQSLALLLFVVAQGRRVWRLSLVPALTDVVAWLLLCCTILRVSHCPCALSPSGDGCCGCSLLLALARIVVWVVACFVDLVRSREFPFWWPSWA